jgi:hypothetical protein
MLHREDVRIGFGNPLGDPIPDIRPDPHRINIGLIVVRFVERASLSFQFWQVLANFTEFLRSFDQCTLATLLLLRRHRFIDDALGGEGRKL